MTKTTISKIKREMTHWEKKILAMSEIKEQAHNIKEVLKIKEKTKMQEEKWIKDMNRQFM